MLEIYENNTQTEKLKKCKRVLDELKVPYQTLQVEEINRRFKPFHFNGDGYSAIYEPQGGTLMASKCVLAFQVYTYMLFYKNNIFFVPCEYS